MGRPSHADLFSDATDQHSHPANMTNAESLARLRQLGARSSLYGAAINSVAAGSTIPDAEDWGLPELSGECQLSRNLSTTAVVANRPRPGARPSTARKSSAAVQRSSPLTGVAAELPGDNSPLASTAAELPGNSSYPVARPEVPSRSHRSRRPCPPVPSQDPGLYYVGDDDDSHSAATSPSSTRSSKTRSRTAQSSSSSRRVSRSPSPGRGAFIESARQRMSWMDEAAAAVQRQLHRELQKAGRRPLDGEGFVVHQVRHSPIDDFAMAWARDKTATQPPAAGDGYRPRGGRSAEVAEMDAGRKQAVEMDAGRKQAVEMDAGENEEARGKRTGFPSTTSSRGRGNDRKRDSYMPPASSQTSELFVKTERPAASATALRRPRDSTKRDSCVPPASAQSSELFVKTARPAASDTALRRPIDSTKRDSYMPPASAQSSELIVKTVSSDTALQRPRDSTKRDSYVPPASPQSSELCVKTARPTASDTALRRPLDKTKRDSYVPPASAQSSELFVKTASSDAALQRPQPGGPDSTPQRAAPQMTGRMDSLFLGAAVRRKPCPATQPYLQPPARRVSRPAVSGEQLGAAWLPSHYDAGAAPDHRRSLPSQSPLLPPSHRAHAAGETGPVPVAPPVPSDAALPRRPEQPGRPTTRDGDDGTSNPSRILRQKSRFTDFAQLGRR